MIIGLTSARELNSLVGVVTSGLWGGRYGAKVTTPSGVLRTIAVKSINLANLANSGWAGENIETFRGSLANNDSDEPQASFCKRSDQNGVSFTRGGRHRPGCATGRFPLS